ncbi:MAG: ABC transporter permease [Alphaproteobacteria bacterium]|nr:ABC transporter permease [Alphaproteobacteria bacterium]
MRLLRRHPTMAFGAVILLVAAALAILAPVLWTVDPQQINPARRLRPPSREAWFGTDMFGRDLWSRVVYGTRVSLIVGFGVMAISVSIGLAIGLVSGYVRRLDAVVMRLMDGMMAIPAILLAIALMSLTKPSIGNVVIAISVAEIPRVVRLVRGMVLTLREEPYVAAAVTSGSRMPRILLRHVLPNTMAPLLVQGTYVFAAAILIEAALSFLGAGTPSSVASWGNIIAEGRSLFLLATWIVLIPGFFLSLMVLAINLLGDGLRDALDPRFTKRL